MSLVTLTVTSVDKHQHKCTLPAQVFTNTMSLVTLTVTSVDKHQHKCTLPAQVFIPAQVFTNTMSLVTLTVTSVDEHQHKCTLPAQVFTNTMSLVTLTVTNNVTKFAFEFYNIQTPNTLYVLMPFYNMQIYRKKLMSHKITHFTQ